MKKLLLNKKEFKDLYGVSRFELNPLDVNLVRMQQSLSRRVKPELFDHPECKAINETYESKNPEAYFLSVKVECCRSDNRLYPYDMWLTVDDLEHKRERNLKFAMGDEQYLTDFLGSNKFLSKCKDEVLYINYEYEHYHSFR